MLLACLHLISAFCVALRSPSVFGSRLSLTSVSSLLLAAMSSLLRLLTKCKARVQRARLVPHFESKGKSSISTVSAPSPALRIFPVLVLGKKLSHSIQI